MPQGRSTSAGRSLRQLVSPRIRTKFVKHPDRKVVLYVKDKKVVVVLRHWSKVPCDPLRCSSLKKGWWPCMFLCHTRGTAPMSYEQQVFAGSLAHCQQFIRGYDRGSMQDRKLLGQWLDKNKESHTCDGVVMPIYLGKEVAYRYAHVPAELWNSCLNKRSEVRSTLEGSSPADKPPGTIQTT